MTPACLSQHCHCKFTAIKTCCIHVLFYKKLASADAAQNGCDLHVGKLRILNLSWFPSSRDCLKQQSGPPCLGGNILNLIMPLFLRHHWKKPLLCLLECLATLLPGSAGLVMSKSSSCHHHGLLPIKVISKS